MQQCSICLDDLDGAGPTLACGHRTRTPKVIVDPEAPTIAYYPPGKGRHGKRVSESVEGAAQKQNGKWANTRLFPGREFDDLDAYRAAKKQRKERRAAYSAQVNAYDRRR